MVHMTEWAHRAHKHPASDTRGTQGTQGTRGYTGKQRMRNPPRRITLRGSAQTRTETWYGLQQCQLLHAGLLIQARLTKAGCEEWVPTKCRLHCNDRWSVFPFRHLYKAHDMYDEWCFQRAVSHPTITTLLVIFLPFLSTRFNSVPSGDLSNSI